MQPSSAMAGKARNMKSILKCRKGQNLVEFAIVVPLLILLVVGIAEFGRAWMSQNIITGAAREAVRIAAVPPPAGSVAAGTARANEILDSAGIPAASRGVTVPDPGVTFGAVTATVTCNFQFVAWQIIPGLASDTITLTSTTTMRREY